jgi:hypothetical protein
MLDLQCSISTIEKLLNEDSSAGLTYAALECRLAIEQICYERLRVTHDYISHDGLRRWQPKDIVNTLIKEVDTEIASTFTLFISKEPIPDGMRSPSLEDYQAMEYIPVGTQVGFDPDKLGKLWHALSNAALHIKIPKNKDDTVPQYGEPEIIRAKVLEALDEIRRIASGNLLASGLGEEISFECLCGTRNKRRLGLLRDGQAISCVNPECAESFDYEENTGSFNRRTFEIVCRKCQTMQPVPKKMVEKLRTNQRIYFNCEGCEESIYIQWRPMQDQKTKPHKPSDAST